MVLSAIILATMMTSVRADSIWNHNGSTMMLNVDGSRVAFSYLQPRSVIAAQGVEPGTVLFSGRRSRSGSLDDWGYTGTAYIFSANCGKHAFAVKGTDMWDPFPKISLTGKAPRIDQQTCRQIGEREETLVFEYQLPDLPGISDASLQYDGDGCVSRMPRAKCKFNMPRPRRELRPGKMLPSCGGSDLSE